MAIPTAPANESVKKEQRRTKNLFLIVGICGVIASFFPFVLTGFGVPKHTALRVRFWAICPCCLILSIHFTYSAISTWRRGYIITDSGKIERKTRYFAFIGRFLVDVYMAILL